MVNLELNKRLVKDVQKSLGFVSNDIDGIVGPKTRSAIASYQTRNNLVVTGIINQELIESLGCIDTDKSGSLLFETLFMFGCFIFSKISVFLS